MAQLPSDVILHNDAQARGNAIFAVHATCLPVLRRCVLHTLHSAAMPPCDAHPQAMLRGRVRRPTWDCTWSALWASSWTPKSEQLAVESAVGLAAGFRGCMFIQLEG